MNGPIWVVVIEHRYGFNHYAAQTDEGRKEILYGYVKEWWNEVDHLEEIPSDKQEAIDRYFEEVEEEWYTCDLVTLRP